MSDPDVRAVDAVVHGRVQGVFFRDSCRERAVEARVGGWVRNEPDGTVRVHVEGSTDAVDRLLGWLEQGPPQADVDRVDRTDEQAEGLGSFEVR